MFINTFMLYKIYVFLNVHLYTPMYMCIYIYVNVHTSYEWAWEQQHPNGDNAQILALIPFSTKNKQRSLEK